MSGTPQSNAPNSSFDSQAIEAICDRFEFAWRADQRPSLEQHLSEAPAERRTALLCELLKLELYYRRKKGERPTPADYRSRFPDDGELLDLIFDDPDANPGKTVAEGIVVGDARPVAAGESRYVTLRFHARGGLGEVHVAHDVELSRRVALKRMQAHCAGDDDYRRRFLAEAEITGQLEHPGVVPVYGLVQGADGQPHYAMRFIQGETLQAAIRRYHEADAPGRNAAERGLALRQLLSRFIAVCNTIAYAHSRGILHRDLKPANVMLGKYGETLVVDWGLAKAFERDAAARAAGEETLLPTPRPAPSSGETGMSDAAGTRTGFPMGTPAFMSPEQARGDQDRATPAGDIFGLGAMLYNLLANRPPYGGQSQTEVVVQAKQGKFPPPSEVQSGVPPALEAICLKAMAFKPQDRYSSPLALAADVEHWLADEPVSSYSEPSALRLRRWVRRHARLVTGVAASLVVGVGALALLVWQSERARRALANEQSVTIRERDEKGVALRTAEKRLAQVERGLEILGSVFTSLDPKAVAKEDEPLTYLLGKQLERATNELAGEAVGDQLGVARLQMKLGLAQFNLGNHRQAITTYASARATFDAQLGSDHSDTLTTMSDLARAYESAGRLDLALPLYEEALQRKKAKLGPDHPDTLTSMSDLAGGYASAGNLHQALPLHEEALRLTKSKLGPDHHETLTSISHLATAYRLAGKLDLAIPLFEEALWRLKAKLGPDHPDTLAGMGNLAGGYQSAGMWDLALPHFEEALQLTKAKLGPDHPDTLNCMNNLAVGYQSAGKPHLALPLNEEALRLTKAKHGTDHPRTLTSMNNLALSYQSAGKSHLALPLNEEALRLRKSRLGPDHPDTLNSMHNLAKGYEVTGKLDLALPLYEETLRLKKTKLGADHPETLAGISALAGGYFSVRKLDLALPLFEEALRLMKIKLGPDHPDTLAGINNIAVCHESTGRLDLALPLYEEALRLRKAKLGPDHPGTLTSVGNLAAAYLAAKEPGQALPLFHEFLAGHQRQLGDSTRLAGFQASIADRLLKASQPAAAESILRACVAILEKQELNSWKTFIAKSMLGAALLGQDKLTDAEPLLLAGFDGLKQQIDKVPKDSKFRLPEVAERLVRLYDALGKPDEAAKYRKELEALKAAK